MASSVLLVQLYLGDVQALVFQGIVVEDLLGFE